MAAEQGRDMGTGRVPGLNTERIYSTTVPAEELAQALADHFRGQGFEAQVFRTSGDRTAMQARKESLWRNLLGVAYALTVTFTSGEGQLANRGRLVRCHRPVPGVLGYAHASSDGARAPSQRRISSATRTRSAHGDCPRDCAQRS
jgi:hypothetical protein